MKNVHMLRVERVYSLLYNLHTYNGGRVSSCIANGGVFGVFEDVWSFGYLENEYGWDDFENPPAPLK